MSQIVNSGIIKCSIGVGSMILNDYLLEVSEIEGGHRLTVTRGSSVQTMDVMDGVGGGVNIEIDTTLTHEGMAADAKATGDKIAQINDRIDKLNFVADNGTIKVIAINNVSLIPQDGVVNIPIANGESLGVVKSTDEENGITIREDGTMYLNSISMDKVVQGESADGTETTVIFSGGGAS